MIWVIRVVPLLVAAVCLGLNQLNHVSGQGCVFSYIVVAMGLALIYLSSYFKYISKEGGWLGGGVDGAQVFLRPQDLPRGIFIFLGYIFLVVGYIPWIGAITT
jgi:hypothetical protein